MATLRRLTIATTWTFTASSRVTTFTSLVAHAVPAGARIEVICKGGGCPFRNQRLTVSARTCGKNQGRCKSSSRRERDIELTSLLRHAHLSRNAKLTVTFTLRFYIGQVHAFTIGPAGPISRTACLAPGAPRPGRGC
jgi:hypothetical protein